MAKLKNPLNSLRASGSLGKALSFVRRRGRDLVEKRPVPTDARSEAQVSWRTMFGLCKDLWHELSAAEKAVWEAAGTARHMTGYAWYLSQCLRPNPGIYLPLAGGAMSGDIDMAAHSLLALPDPTLAQDAATKAYVDALDRGEGHITILPFDYDSVGQGTFLLDVAPLQTTNIGFYNSSNSNGDNISYKAYLAAGTYTLRLLSDKRDTRAIIDIDIDGVEVASFDLYNAAILWRILSSQTGIVIATPGLKTIRVRVDGRNGLAIGWYLWFSTLTLWRTS